MSNKQEDPQCLRAAFGSRWNPSLNAYDDIQAVSFVSQGDLDEAIASFWENPELKGAPRLHVGNFTMFMPNEAAKILHRGGHIFTQSRVAKGGDQKKEALKGMHTVSF